VFIPSVARDGDETEGTGDPTEKCQHLKNGLSGGPPSYFPWQVKEFEGIQLLLVLLEKQPCVVQGQQMKDTTGNPIV